MHMFDHQKTVTRIIIQGHSNTPNTTQLSTNREQSNKLKYIPNASTTQL